MTALHVGNSLDYWPLLVTILARKSGLELGKVLDYSRFTSPFDHIIFVRLGQDWCVEDLPRRTPLPAVRAQTLAIHEFWTSTAKAIGMWCACCINLYNCWSLNQFMCCPVHRHQPCSGPVWRRITEHIQGLTRLYCESLNSIRATIIRQDWDWAVYSGLPQLSYAAVQNNCGKPL